MIVPRSAPKPLVAAAQAAAGPDAVHGEAAQNAVLPTRLVVGWDVFAALYIVLAYFMMLRCDVGHIRRSAVLQDDGRFLLLLLTALGAFASLAAIVIELSAPRKATRPGWSWPP